MARIDYLEDEDGDLLFENGELVRGEADQKHIKDALECAPGHWRQYPMFGLNPHKYAKKSTGEIDSRRIKREANITLSQDGYKNVNIDTSKGLDKLELNI